MKTMLVALSLFSLTSLLAQARESWQMCLDEGDFSFTADSFLKSARVAKNGCVFRFTEIGGRGKKFEVNVCDAFTNIASFESIDDSHAEKLYAGSNGCPAPLFGADIDAPPGSGPEYTAAKQEVFTTFELVRKALAPNPESVNLNHVKNASKAGSEVKLACAQLLLDGYLNQCETYTPATETNPAPEAAKPVDEKNLGPGILPQNIPRTKD